MATNMGTITTARMVMGTSHPMVVCLWMWVMNFVMEQIEVSAKVGDEEKAVIFKPVELDGVTATDQPTSLYMAEVDWLMNAANFNGTVRELKIEGKIFSEIAFQFTKPD